jgi:hypothetical protein
VVNPRRRTPFRRADNIGHPRFNNPTEACKTHVIVMAALLTPRPHHAFAALHHFGSTSSRVNPWTGRGRIPIQIFISAPWSIHPPHCHVPPDLPWQMFMSAIMVAGMPHASCANHCGLVAPAMAAWHPCVRGESPLLRLLPFPRNQLKVWACQCGVNRLPTFPICVQSDETRNHFAH